MQFAVSPGPQLLTWVLNDRAQEGLAPIDLKVETVYHRAAPGGTGGVKTIGNYASVSGWRVVSPHASNAVFAASGAYNPYFPICVICRF